VTKSVAIVGAGIVGICTAIELLKTGQKVTLFDKELPGSQSSLWNAGVLATSSLIPLNNPQLISKIPYLLAGRIPGFRLNPGQLLHTLPWAVRFFANSRRWRFDEVVSALNALIGLSRKIHKAHIDDLGQPDLLVENGWLFIYRTKAGFADSAFQGEILDQYHVAHQVLDADMLSELEPGLSRNVYGARHISDSLSTEPAMLLSAYIEYARRLGAKFRRVEVKSIARKTAGIALASEGNNIEIFDNVVVAAGAWSNQLLQSVNIKLPMVVERGYLKTFSLRGATKLNRPFFDVEAGYVASPRQCGIQISTGTELTTVDAAPNEIQLHNAVEQLKTLLPLGNPQMDSAAVSNRPSLTDSLPVIGPVKKVPGLWLATGHQHMGFSTSAGTGRLLSALINRTKPDIDPEPYLPARFNI